MISSNVQNICVFCGSRAGTNPFYEAAAIKLGQFMAQNHIRLIYGGGSTGLMGIIARAVLSHGGQVTGIIPQFLVNKEVMLKEADEIIITQDMHERKMAMFDRSDAFIALPGGIGTLEEVVEQITWVQLGQHNKPIIFANIDNFWTGFFDLINHMGKEAFIEPDFKKNYHMAKDIDAIAHILSEAL